ncbi:universal stress protein [Streptomyces sp. SudanB66_2053]|uniref:universal stress protein n=1 Tax=Streptomyces sp. SudanB66_2053 TaxID=3035277 RepID=UPI003F5534E5
MPGSRGPGRVAGLLAGSVSLGVVARATRPVVLVRADAGGDARPDVVADAEGEARRDVVVGVDVIEPCDGLLAYAFEAARRHRARLRALHAWRAPDRLTLGAAGAGPADGQEWAGEWLRFLSAVLQVRRDKCPDVEVLETVPEGEPAGTLLKAASEARLLVVGHQVSGRPAPRRTGPVTHAVIHQARCLLAVVPHVRRPHAACSRRIRRDGAPSVRPQGRHLLRPTLGGPRARVPLVAHARPE